MSREKRWKKRGGAGLLGKALAGLAVLGVAMALWVVYKPDAVPAPAPLAFPDFVAEAEATFPEALRGQTRAQGGQLADGRTVPMSISLLVPTHALESASASSDALTRLSAPFVGTERAISGVEMGNRIAKLASIALPSGVTSCYTYNAGAPRGVAISDTRKVRATPLEIAFNPEC